MIVVAGVIEIAKADIERGRKAAIEMMQETAKEDGCIIYRFSQDLENPAQFRIYEEWETADSLAAHGRSAHMGVFRKALADLNILARDVKMFEAGPSKPL